MKWLLIAVLFACIKLQAEHTNANDGIDVGPTPDCYKFPEYPLCLRQARLQKNVQ